METLLFRTRPGPSDAPPCIPPPPGEGALRIVFLGGLGEIGKNMCVLHCGETAVAVDCGLMFPTEEMYGIDLVIPDISYLLLFKDHMKAILLTHGHEDHIGALPYVLPRLDVPVYGTPFTLALVREKLREFELQDSFRLIPITPGDAIDFGDFHVEAFPVVHSILESVGFAFRTPAGLVVHSGDFKFDESVEGNGRFIERLGALGEEGVALLMADSTYAERSGFSTSELLVRRTLAQVMKEAPGRIIASTFASSLPRIAQILDISRQTGRKVCLLGRSMAVTVALARELGQLYLEEDRLIRAEDLEGFPDKEILILTTGSQGEPLSALSLLASGRHRWVQVRSGDTVVISATPIPGNETTVHRVINQLFRQGAEVIYSLYPDAPGQGKDGLRIHASGHGSREELRLLMQLTKPRFFIPIHGEHRHLMLHARLAIEEGISAERILLVEDGMVVELTREGGAVTGFVPAGDVLVDGLSIGDVGSIVLRDRSHLACDGICVVVAGLDRISTELTSGPELITKGFIYVPDGQDLIDGACCLTREILARKKGGQPADVSTLQERLRSALARYFKEKIGRRPMIVPVLMEI
jgi:ribonuclease J